MIYNHINFSYQFITASPSNASISKYHSLGIIFCLVYSSNSLMACTDRQTHNVRAFTAKQSVEIKQDVNTVVSGTSVSEKEIDVTQNMFVCACACVCANGNNKRFCCKVILARDRFLRLMNSSNCPSVCVRNQIQTLI